MRTRLLDGAEAGVTVVAGGGGRFLFWIYSLRSLESCQQKRPSLLLQSPSPLFLQHQSLTLCTPATQLNLQTHFMNSGES